MRTSGESPARQHACQVNQPWAQRLIAANADSYLGDKNNQTPRMKAAPEDRVDVIVLSLAHCAITDTLDSFLKWNALRFAKSDAAKSAIQAGMGASWQ